MPGGQRSPPGVNHSGRSTTSESHNSNGLGVNNETTYYGDFIGRKQSKVFRGVCCQLGGLGKDPNGPKHEALTKAMARFDVDVIALQEVGINFRYTGIKGGLKQRLGWNREIDGQSTKIVNAWNTNSRKRSVSQVGGTAIISQGETSHYTAGMGKDPTNLGRWCWSRYQGAGNTHLRVISFYRPCLKNNPGALSVMAQHTNSFQSQDDDRLPRQAFLEDFRVSIP
jgi:hypothetical protein